MYLTDTQIEEEEAQPARRKKEEEEAAAVAVAVKTSGKRGKKCTKNVF